MRSSRPNADHGHKTNRDASPTRHVATPLLILVGLTLCACPAFTPPSVTENASVDAPSEACLATLGDSAACAATNCETIARSGGEDGVYWLRGQPVAETVPYQAYCLSSVANGGWQLISSRTRDSGALFADWACLDPGDDCAGTIPHNQIDVDRPLSLLLATRNLDVWMVLAGFSPPGADGLVDVITLERPLSESPSYEYPHFAGPANDFDGPIIVTQHSSQFTPRYPGCMYLWLGSGGIYCGSGGDSALHLFSFNMSAYCGNGGLDVSGGHSQQFGDIACGQAGALYFRYD